jgi:hypothetical protein
VRTVKGNDSAEGLLDRDSAPGLVDDIRSHGCGYHEETLNQGKNKSQHF